MATRAHDTNTDTLPTEGARADQARIAALEGYLSDALRENALLRRDRQRWASEAQRLLADVGRLRQQLEGARQRRWP
jgi:hypothetical protein